MRKPAPAAAFHVAYYSLQPGTIKEYASLQERALAPQVEELQLEQNKYFARKLPGINILQTQSPCKLIKTIDLLTNYPQQGGRGVAEMKGKKRN
jgi:hypothetical protein